MNSYGSRRGTQTLDEVLYGDKSDDVEEAIEESYHREYQWREDKMGESPESIYIRKETREEVLAAMTDKQREVFVLYYDRGYRQQEIAEMLGVSQPTICEHLENALKCVRR